MPTDVTNESIDPALIAKITREVIARLGEAGGSPEPRPTSNAESTDASIDDPVITAGTLAKLTTRGPRLLIAAGAVVTPAAADEARRRGITLHRSAAVSAQQLPEHAELRITDSSDPGRADAVRGQLQRRGEALGGAAIVLSDTPARDVYQQCASGGEIAVMITTLTDVARFAGELSPTVWVLDMQRLNIPTAVNVIAQISRIERTKQ